MPNSLLLFPSAICPLPSALCLLPYLRGAEIRRKKAVNTDPAIATRFLQ